MSAGLLRLLLGAGALYALYAAAGFFLQRSMLFPGTGLRGRGEAPPDTEQVWLQTPTARVEAWWMPPPASASGEQPAPALLFAHGNAELIDDWSDGFAFLRAAGMAVLLVEYPGYGRSGGSPSRDSIQRAMAGALEWLRARRDVDSGRIVLYGRSLGGGAVCTQLAQGPAAVVLQSTFASLRPFARALLLPPLLIRDRFDNEAALRAYRGPSLVLHGRRDDVIPFSHGQTLARAARDGRFVPLDCAHNDCLPEAPHIARELLAFLRLHELLPSGVTHTGETPGLTR